MFQILLLNNSTALGDSELLPSQGESHPLATVGNHASSTAVTTNWSLEHLGRVVEVGFLPNFRPRPFALHFERFPIWLLALEKSFCSRLIMLGVQSVHELKTRLEAIGAPVVLAHRAIVHLGLGRVTYSAAV